MLNDYIFYTYLCILILSVLVGIYRYKRLEKAEKIILLLLFVTTLSEIICQVRIKSGLGKAPVYHIYSVIEIILTSFYFIETIKPYHHVLFKRFTLIFWPLIAILNIIFLQPLYKFNSNILLLESMSIIALALYALYTILLDDFYINVFRQPRFWIWSLQLFMWSSSFFFWGYYEVLIQRGWPFISTFAKVQAVINIFVYLGIGLTLFFYPKSQPRVLNDY